MTKKFKISGQLRDPEYGNLEIQLSPDGKRVKVRDMDTLEVSEWTYVSAGGTFHYNGDLFHVSEFHNLN